MEERWSQRRYVEERNDDFQSFQQQKQPPQWARAERRLNERDSVKEETLQDGLAESIVKVSCKRGSGETH